MKKIHALVASAILAIAFTGCEKQQIEQATGKIDKERQYSNVYTSGWHHYVKLPMGRDCMDPQRGFCFGVPWIVEETGSYAVAPNHTVVEEAYNDGGIFTAVAITEGGTTALHMILVQEGHEDGQVLLEQDFELPEEMANNLGYASITLTAGYYPLDMSTYERGEVLIPCVAVEDNGEGDE